MKASADQLGWAGISQDAGSVQQSLALGLRLYAWAEENTELKRRIVVVVRWLDARLGVAVRA